MDRRSLIALLCAALCFPAGAQNDESNPSIDSEEPEVLDQMTVRSGKAPSPLSSLPTTVTVITEKDLERQQAADIEDMVRYTPGVSVPNNGSRFGRGGFNIRGVGGNRVQIEVDGVPVSDGFAIGDFSNASRDFIDVDLLKQVEIVRGPASSLFGSDALGGVISFVTRDPADLADENGHYLSLRSGYFGDDDSFFLGATGATDFGGSSALLSVTHRSGDELDRPNTDPLDFDTHSLLGKFVFGDAGDGGFRLTADLHRDERETDVVSLRGVQDFTAAFGFPYIITTSLVLADDRRDRDRISVDQEWVGGMGYFDYVHWQAFLQNSETEQDSFEVRATNIAGMITPVERNRTFRFHQHVLGAELVLGKTYHWGVPHNFLFGLELEDYDTEQVRDGLQLDLNTGEISNVVGPDEFPVRDFPNSNTTEMGFFVQDEILLGDGSFSLIPAIRIDRYDLDPSPDAIFLEDNPGIEPVNISETEVSPKLGAVWHLTEDSSLYGQYAEGFRAPPYNDVNVGFTNLAFGYTTIPNPDLESETSKGLELGFRHSAGPWRWNAAGYLNRYDDFIASLQSVGFDPVNNLIIFQSVNLDDVEIYGFEFSANYDAAELLDGLTFRFAAAYARGEDRYTDQPVNTVDPLNAVLGAHYDNPSGHWGMSAVLTGASGQERVDDSAFPVFQPGGYGVTDLFGYINLGESTRLNLGLFNIFDRDYFEWADVSGLPADSRNLDRFQGPGRYAAASVRVGF